MWATRPSTIARASSSHATSPTASRRIFAISSRHPAQMGKSKIECDVGDALVRGGGGNLALRSASRISRSISEIEAPKCRRKPSCSARMPMPEAPASCARSSGSPASARGTRAPAARSAAALGPAPKTVDRIARAVPLAIEQGTQHCLAQSATATGESGRRRPEPFGEIDEFRKLGLKRPAACGGEIDRRIELDRAGRPARQRRGTLLQQATVEQQNELRAIALPDHPCGDRRRQQRSAVAGSGCDVARRVWIRAEPCPGICTRKKRSRQPGSIDRPTIGDVVDGKAVKERAIVPRRKVGRWPCSGLNRCGQKMRPTARPPRRHCRW